MGVSVSSGLRAAPDGSAICAVSRAWDSERPLRGTSDDDRTPSPCGGEGNACCGDSRHAAKVLDCTHGGNPNENAPPGGGGAFSRAGTAGRGSPDGYCAYSLRTASQQAGDERDDEKNQKDEEQDLGDLGGTDRNARETEHCRDDRD